MLTCRFLHKTSITRDRLMCGIHMCSAYLSEHHVMSDNPRAHEYTEPSEIENPYSYRMRTLLVPQIVLRTNAANTLRILKRLHHLSRAFHSRVQPHTARASNRTCNVCVQACLGHIARCSGLISCAHDATQQLNTSYYALSAREATPARATRTNMQAALRRAGDGEGSCSVCQS